MPTLDGDGPDTALARLLHASQRLDLPTLRGALQRARGSAASLAALLAREGHLREEELRPFLARVTGARPLGAGALVDGRYRIEGLLGEGGMGAVYRAREVATGRFVALKVLLGDLSGISDTVERARFLHEGQAGALLGQEQGFVPVHAAGVHQGRHYLVMGYVEGTTLEEAIDDLSPERLRALVAAVARALQRAHEAGVVHRDLKPSNVLLSADGAPVVADLGLARTGLVETLTQTGEVLGTPAYMAPEQVQDARSVDARTDVYALGAILYRGLAGRPPYQGSLVNVLHGVLHASPPAPSALKPGVPRDLEQVCLRALEKDPTARYPSAAALADALEAPPEAAGAGRALGVAIALLAVLALAVLGRGYGSQPRPSPSSHAVRLDPVDPGPLREALLAAARGERARRPRVQPGLGAQRAVLAEVRAECARALAQARDPAFTYRSWRALLDEELVGETAGVTDEAFDVLLEAEDWDRLLALQTARLPLPVPERVLVGALAKIQSDQGSGARLSSWTTRLAFQLGLPVRGGGGVLYQPLAEGTETLPYPRGSAAQAFARLARAVPPGSRRLFELPEGELRRIHGLARDVRLAPLRDLGALYCMEAEGLELRLARQLGKTSRTDLQRLADLRERAQRHWLPAFAVDFTYLERQCLPPDAADVALPRWERLLERLSQQRRPPYAPPAEVFDEALVQAQANLLRELAIAERWGEVERFLVTTPPVPGQHQAARDFYGAVVAARKELPHAPGEALRVLESFQPPRAGGKIQLGRSYGGVEQTLSVLLVAQIHGLRGELAVAREYLAQVLAVEPDFDPYLIVLKGRAEAERRALEGK